MRFFSILKNRKGQSLFEILIAATVSAILIAAAVSLISPVIRNNASTARLQVGGALGKELLENIKVLSNSNWSAVGSLTVGSNNRYWLSTSTNPFSVVVGTENLSLNNATYTRYFYLENAWRISEDGGALTTNPTGAYLDPSTRRVVVVYGVLNNRTSSLSQYITRSRNESYVQTDWSGGATSSVVSSSPSVFGTSTNLTFTTSSGSIIIDL